MLYGARVAMVLGLVVLAGCTEKAQQSPTLGPLSPSPSASPSPSPSAVASGPARPVGTDVQQVVALARAYYAESNRALSTGHTLLLRSMSTPNCRCLTSADYVDKLWKTGSVRASNYYRVREVTFPKITSTTTAFATVIYTNGPEVDLDAFGKVLHEYPADSKPEGATLDFVRVNGTWKVSDLVRNTN